MTNELVLGVFGLAFLIGVPLFFRRMVRVYVAELEAQKRRRELMLTAREEFQADINKYTALEERLSAERTAIYASLESLKPQDNPQAQAAAEPVKTVLDVLLEMGKVDREGISKAEKFKAESKSPYSVEDVLVMIDVISAEDLALAKRSVKP